MKKIIFLVFVILNFSSCEDEVLKAKHCSHNGETVDCATMEPKPQANPGGTLVAKTSSEYDFNENGIFEFINGGSERVEDSYGNSCEITIPAMEMQYALSQDGLSLTFTDEENNSSTFDRAVAEASIYGRWIQVDEENNLTTTINLQDNGIVMFELTCQF